VTALLARAPAVGRRPAPGRGLGVGALALVLLTATGVIVAGQWWLAVQRADRQQETIVHQAADRAVERVLSYDYRRLDEGAAHTRRLLTDDFQQQYTSLHDEVQRSAPELKASITAVVRQSTVLEADDDSARVLLFVDQTTVSRELNGPRLDQSRVLATLVRQDGEWLVDSVRAV
jgi:Mce-associated membrane protein